VASEKNEVISVLNFCLELSLVCGATVQIVWHALVNSMADQENILSLLINNYWEIVIPCDKLLSCSEVVKPKVGNAELRRKLRDSLAWSVIV
jgi:hypothetical protein